MAQEQNEIYQNSLADGDEMNAQSSPLNAVADGDKQHDAGTQTRTRCCTCFL